MGKYGSKSCKCWSGHIHQSILEADYCNELYLMRKGKLITEYISQHDIEIYVNDIFICTHRVDFLVTYPDGHKEFHEVKGVATDVWKIKRKLTMALFPETPYIVKSERGALWTKTKQGSRRQSLSRHWKTKYPSSRRRWS